MCVSLVGQITCLDGEHAVVDVGGIERKASLAMLLLESQEVSTGDWVLIHTGFAVAVLDPDDAAELTRLHHDLSTSNGDARP